MEQFYVTRNIKISCFYFLFGVAHTSSKGGNLTLITDNLSDDVRRRRKKLFIDDK
jgi:Flp pilus assembly protein TadB